VSSWTNQHFRENSLHRRENQAHEKQPWEPALVKNVAVKNLRQQLENKSGRAKTSGKKQVSTKEESRGQIPNDNPQ